MEKDKPLRDMMIVRSSAFLEPKVYESGFKEAVKILVTCTQQTCDRLAKRESFVGSEFLFGAEAVLDELKEALESLKSKDED